MSKSNIPSGDAAKYSIPPKSTWHNLVKDDIKLEGFKVKKFAVEKNSFILDIHDGTSFCFVNVNFANSEKEAIREFFWNLAKYYPHDEDFSYKVWKEGPGSICIVRSNFDEETQKFDAGYSRHIELFFVRDGIRVTTLNHTIDDIAKLARLIDEQIILASEKMKQEK